MKKETNFFLAGGFIGLVVAGSIFRFSQPTPIIKINIEDKIKYCTEMKGVLRLWDYSDNGSDYRLYCEIPEQTKFEYKLNN